MKITGRKKHQTGNNKEKMGQTYGISELAEIFKVSEKTMYGLVERLGLPRVEGLGKILVYEWELHKWFHENSRKRRKFAKH
ncbi:MAG: helix-turn-helix domain-containing protein [bacterium]|nr:helix-turn-helix domain-containing protein [bacterium]